MGFSISMCHPRMAELEDGHTRIVPDDGDLKSVSLSWDAMGVVYAMLWDVDALVEARPNPDVPDCALAAQERDFKPDRMGRVPPFAVDHPSGKMPAYKLESNGDGWVVTQGEARLMADGMSRVTVGHVVEAVAHLAAKDRPLTSQMLPGIVADFAAFCADAAKFSEGLFVC
jgi:hypothetical protein